MSLVASTRLVLPEKAGPAAPWLGPKRVAYQPSSWLRPPLRGSWAQPHLGPKRTSLRRPRRVTANLGARAHQVQRFSHCATGAPRQLGSPTRQIWRRCLTPSPVPMLLKGRFAKPPVARWAYCECSALPIFERSGRSYRWAGKVVIRPGSVVRSGWRAQWCCVAGGIRGRGHGWSGRSMGWACA